jgi:hypothetical protein
MKVTSGTVACGIAGLLVGLLSVLVLSATAAAHNDTHDVIDAVYPLFSTGITWSPKVSVSLPPKSDYNPTDKIIDGYQVSSYPTASTEDIGGVVGPMRDYYDRLLLQKGWTMDTKFEADGPGGSLWGFTKAGDILILSYTSTFMDIEPGRPNRCPCTVVFTIIGGSLK